MTQAQPAILDALPPLARYLEFNLAAPADPTAALRRLAPQVDGRRLVLGIGAPLVAMLGREVPGLRVPAAAAGPGIEVPATPAALWCWLRGDDRGDLFHAA
ncbi:MAG TPA: peroxidase, partial [Rubrivivax sp.]|nr:peroxidase [Rubrivivax sp.]